MPVVALIAVGIAFRAVGLAGLLILCVLAAVAYHQRTRLNFLLRRLPGRLSSSAGGAGGAGEAGASSFARARALRTPWVRLLTAVGITTRAESLARRCVAGGMGEREAARLLAPLLAEGWVFLYDRRLPRGRANIDILGFGPSGAVYNLDPKKWSAQHRLWVDAGARLMHGNRNVTARLDGIRHETRTINSLLSVQALSVALMIGPLAPGEQLHIAGVRIIPAADACDVLRALDARQIPRQRGPQFVDVAARLMPSYTRS